MTSVFVVGLVRQGVLSRRAYVRRYRLIVGSLCFGLAFVNMMVPFSLLFLGFDGIWVITAILSTGMLPLVVVTGLVLWKTIRLNRWYAATDLPPFAMRMSPAALELGCEGTTEPVVLPWPVVPGFRVRRRYRQLVLELASPIPSRTPGVTGLDQPTARAALGRARLLRPAGFYSLTAFDQPVQAIDAALRSFAGGRAGILVADTIPELRGKAWVLVFLAVLIMVIGLFVVAEWNSPILGIAMVLGGALVLPAARRLFQQVSAAKR